MPPNDPCCAAWLNREQVLHERMDARAVAALAATLDWDHAPTDGDPLPPGWQWLFFNPVVRQSMLGQDGHPHRPGTTTTCACCGNTPMPG
ncbi:hypothetical protein [Variovorax paradoxus]|uniref:hypothetical protein n=1 Tax=Variovorax paradoxus TaxID=34073 RepID=UPI00285C4B7A|nr:hypothetical protein [Variovorax paradoxus]MDR6455599.1 hydroxyacyl-ACP dehydratase HTD2-like protein with hotdog domain [Variovorax paradoxus]